MEGFLETQRLFFYIRGGTTGRFSRSGAKGSYEWGWWTSVDNQPLPRRGLQESWSVPSVPDVIHSAQGLTPPLGIRVTRRVRTLEGSDQFTDFSGSKTPRHKPNFRSPLLFAVKNWFYLDQEIDPVMGEGRVVRGRVKS